MKTQQDVYQLICDHYDTRGIAYQRVDEDFMILAVNKERAVPVNLITRVDADPVSVLFCGRLPFKVPEHQREMMVMALQAINQRLSAGRFQMNPEDGVIDYRLNMPLVGIEVDDQWLEHILEYTTDIITDRDEKILSLLREEITFEEFTRKVR